MALEALEHFTIASSDMARTRAFYCDVLGLKDGFRPGMGLPGHWLYSGEVPIVHLTTDQGGIANHTADERGTGPLDHIAFRGRDAEAMIARLKAHNIAYRENRLADIGLHQLFVEDPNGILIEMNFRDAPA